MTDDDVTGFDWDSRSDFWRRISGRFARASAVIVVLGVAVTVVAVQMTHVDVAVNVSNQIGPIEPRVDAPQSQIPLLALYVSCASLAVSLTGMLSSMILGWRADRRAVAAARAAEAAAAARQAEVHP